MWVSNSIPAWIAYDLSSVPVNQRQQVFIAWYANWALGYINPSPTPDLHIPVDYTIEINPAAGGGNSAPTTGWQTVVTVTGNNRGTRQHLVNLAGANWVRLRVTASSNPNDVALDFDVHSAPDGASDSWLFMGDSITGDMAYIFSNVPSLVHGIAPARWPAIAPASIGGSNAWSANDVIDDTLSLFPGRFVTLNYGTNGGSDGFTQAMEILVQKVLAAGKIPVIPHMPWSDIPDQLAKAPSINAQIDALCAKYPAIRRGPDLYTAFLGHPEWIPSGDVHPNDAGAQEYRRQWALAMTAANDGTDSTIFPPSNVVVTITVTNIPPATPATPVISAFAASAATITAGNSTTLTWAATGATRFSISPSVGTVSGNSVSVSPSVTTIYTLTAANDTGSATQMLTVTVATGSTTAPVIASFNATPATLTMGSSAALSWSVSGATSLSITPGVGAGTGTSTSVSPTTTTTYVLTATNAAGSVTKDLTVSVAPPSGAAPVINSFTADTSSLATTGLCTLLWNVTGATTLSISPDIGTVTGNTISFSPLASTTYTLSATNAGGTVTTTTQVTLTTPALTLEQAPVVKIKRDDHVATVEMDFDESAGWGNQLWTVGTNGRDGCGYRVQWWADAAAVSTILATDGCGSDSATGTGANSLLAVGRQMVTPNRIVQLQPLANNALYHVRVERLNGLGQVCSQPTELTFNGGDGTRVAALRSSMTFFDDFNLPMGAPDERKWNNAMAPQTDPRYSMFFVNDQCHVHTLNGTLNEAAGDKSQVAERPRKAIAIEAGVRRRIVFDMDALFGPRSVWYLDLNPIPTDLTGHSSFFDEDGEKALPASVIRFKETGDQFSVHLIDSTGASYEIAETTLSDFGRRMCTNVRRSFDIRLGTDGVQVFVDGTSVMNIPFAAGAVQPGTYDLLWSTIGYNSSKENDPYFLSHWDNFGFDGPDLESRAVHNYVTRIAGTDLQHANASNNARPTFTVNIPDDIRPTAPGAKSEAWLVFNYMEEDYSYTTINPGDHVLVNGTTSVALPPQQNNTSPLDPTTLGWNSPSTLRIKLGEVAQGGVSPLAIGNNTFQFFATNTGITNLHVEVFTPKSAEPPFTPPSALHTVPLLADVPKVGPPASFVFIGGKEWTETDAGTIQGPTVSGKIDAEVLVGNKNWANWAPQWLVFPAASTELWGQGGTTGIKTVELFLRRKGTGTGPGDRIAVLNTNRDAPAPQVRYVFAIDTSRFPNGDYELFVLATTSTGLKSHPEYPGSAFRWDASVWSGAYEPVNITIAN
ncbi:MAG: GDSL-type esterase/lipase family protein [Lacunisphaera sp.]